MPTIADLYSAFAELEELAPAELRPVPGPASSNATLIHALARTAGRRPRRALAVLASSAVVAATVIALTVASSPGSGSARPNNGPAAATTSNPAGPSVATSDAPSVLSLTSGYANLGRLPDGLAVSADEHLGRDYEHVTLSTATGTSAADLYVSAPSAWHPSQPPDAATVTVNGRLGHVASDFDLAGAPSSLALDRASAPGITWDDADGRWFFLTHLSPQSIGSIDHPIASAQLLAIAEAVPLRPQALKSPIKIGYVPAGLTPQAITIGDLAATTTPSVGIDFGRLIITSTPGTSLIGKIGPDADAAPQTTSIAINGFTGRYSPQDSVAVLQKSGVTVVINNYRGAKFVGPGLGLPLDQLTKILNSITVTTTPGDSAGWFTLAAALP